MLPQLLIGPNIRDCSSKQVQKTRLFLTRRDHEWEQTEVKTRALLRFQKNISCCCLSSGVSYNTPIEEFTFIVASWVIGARWWEIRKFVLEFKARYFFLNSYIRCFLFEKSNLRVQRKNTLHRLECKEVRDQFLGSLDFPIHFL